MNRLTLLIATVVIIVAALLPLALNAYLVRISGVVLLGAYLATAWNIMGGYAGQHSLGHALFLGIGAYTSTYLFATHNVSPWIGMWIGALLAGVAGWFVAFVCFRYGLKGSYFALVTIAFAEIAVYLVTNIEPLGGSEGLSTPWNGNQPGMMQFEDMRYFYYILLVMCVLAVAITQWISGSRFGYQLMAVRENEDAAEALGVNTFGVKLQASIISAMLTALGGTLFAQFNGHIIPRSVFGEGPSVQILLFAIIGGLGTVWGPVLGALLLAPVAEYARATLSGSFSGAHLLVYGVVMVIVMLYFPKGLMGILDSLRTRFKPTRNLDADFHR